MEFAINYSPQAAELVRAGRIPLDRFKCPEWPDMIATARQQDRPVYVHFGLDAGPVKPRPVDFDAVAAFAESTQTPYVNHHLVAYDRDFPGEPEESESGEARQSVERRMIEALAAATTRFGVEKVIAENIPYMGPTREFRSVCVDPPLIRRVVDRAGCGFLLDVSHARISAHYLGVDPREYILSLPLDRLRELHLTGLAPHEGVLTDHMALSEEDFEWASWALERIHRGEWPRPAIVALEYGGTGEPFAWRSDAKVIEEQAPRLYDMVHAK